MEPLTILGIIFLGIILFLTCGIAITGITLLLAVNKGHSRFQRLFMILAGFFESPLKTMAKLFRLDPKVIDNMIIEIENNLMRNDYMRTDYKDRLMIVPQCLRHPNCPARTSPNTIECIGCGLCSIKEIKKEAEELGYTFVISPGGTFSKRRIKEVKPKAVLGVACEFELREGLDACMEYGVPAQGIPLLKGGCVQTLVDWDKVRETMRAKI